MAKKSAPQKKKAAVAKAKPAKAVKPAKSKAKPAKATPAAKVNKISQSAPKTTPKVAASKQVASKKVKAAPASEVEVKPRKNIVSLIEAEPAAEETAKAEKVSKVKPVKVDRGNLADEKAKWSELFKKYGKDRAQTYKMTETYQALIPLQHKVLGWGFILTNENDRLEVLFENGIRMLISNYKH